jgi:hypothetical protein
VERRGRGRWEKIMKKKENRKRRGRRGEIGEAGKK